MPHARSTSASILQLTILHRQVGDKDPAQSGYWSVRESFVSFVLTNMPMLYPLLKRILQKVGSTISSDTNGVTGPGGSNGQPYRLGSYPDDRSKPKTRDPNPLNEFGSDEHIIMEPAEDSRATSSCQDTSEHEVDVDQRHARDTFGHRAQAFPSPDLEAHKRSFSNSLANGGIMVTTDFVVTEGHHVDGDSRGANAYLDV